MNVSSSASARWVLRLYAAAHCFTRCRWEASACVFTTSVVSHHPPAPRR